MFNNNSGEFDEDPFFSDPFRAHREQMRQMMRSFSEPYGGQTMPSIMDGRNRGRDMAVHPGSSMALRDEHRDMSRSLLPFGRVGNTDMNRSPFSMFDNMMSNMRNTMQDMHRNVENMSTDSNSHSYSSSSVMTYSKVGNEPLKVFQSSSSTLCAPGGIKETRGAVKDSESGLEQMSIGHHIQDRGHVVEKKYNQRTGGKEFNQDFQNMDESEAQSFDDEWQQEVSRFHPFIPMSRLEEPQLCGGHQAALSGPGPVHSDQSRGNAWGNSNMSGPGSTKQ